MIKMNECMYCFVSKSCKVKLEENSLPWNTVHGDHLLLKYILWSDTIANFVFHEFFFFQQSLKKHFNSAFTPDSKISNAFGVLSWDNAKYSGASIIWVACKEVFTGTKSNDWK